MKRLKLIKKYEKMKMHSQKHEKTMLYKNQVFLFKNAVAVNSAYIDVLLRQIKDKDKMIESLKNRINDLEYNLSLAQQENEKLILIIRHLENSLDDALDGNCFYDEFVPDMSE